MKSKIRLFFLTLSLTAASTICWAQNPKMLQFFNETRRDIQNDTRGHNNKYPNQVFKIETQKHKVLPGRVPANYTQPPVENNWQKYQTYDSTWDRYHQEPFLDRIESNVETPSLQNW